MFELDNSCEEEFIVVQKEKSFRMTKDLVGKPVIDRFGFKIGRVNDLIISGILNAAPPTHIKGIMVGKKFIPWSYVKKLGSCFTLKESLMRDDICPVPKDNLFLVKRVLDEQLIDGNGKYVGRVDDIRLTYNIEEHALRVAGLYSGGLSLLMRIGMDVFGNTIPWACVEKIRNEKPTGVVLNFQRSNASVAERFYLHEVRKI
jgi:sporulation protein YlmC with PRC-barrel domain